jgi:V8-like Glu-specific endopeptidase
VKDFPHDCVGVIYGEYSNKLVVGTGFLIGSDLVLTVAHNLSSKGGKVEYQNLVFYPGVSGSLLPENAYKVASHRCPQQYAAAPEGKDLEYDYALLKLDRRVHREKYIELGVNYILQQEQIGIIGYRGGACDINNAFQSCLWKSNAHKIHSYGLRHELTTLKGNSGSPILVKRNGGYVAIAIHKGSPNKNSNEARIITEALLFDLLRWEKEMGS